MSDPPICPTCGSETTTVDDQAEKAPPETGGALMDRLIRQPRPAPLRIEDLVARRKRPPPGGAAA